MFEWLNKLYELISQFFPKWVIFDPRESGVKFVKGRPVLLEPGRVHWYWPVTTTIDQYPCVRQTDQLIAQTMETTDGVTFVVQGIVVYDVPNVMKLLTECQHSVKLIQDISASEVHSVLCAFTWAELKEEQRTGKLDTKLKNAVKKPLDEYGVRVIKCMLTDLAKVRVIKHLMQTQKEPD